MKNEDSTVTAQYLTFKLENEMFAIHVNQAREILDLLPITKMPQLPAFMRGVINVRGSAVPVIDLRLKFGLPEAEDSPDTRIVIIEIEADDETTVLGAVVDAVHEVLEFKPEQIEDAPHIGKRWRTEFIMGIGKHNDEFVIIIDIEKIFSTDELLSVQEIENDTEVDEPINIER
ncbi:chemotaxis protein CheW [Desulfococcaceae bacterium HSG9]|nr:chemotaxis protein CheW [Desulfococcaceae bacterium HSG9]